MSIRNFQEIVEQFEKYGDKIVSYMRKPDNTFRTVTFAEMRQSAKNFAAYLDAVKGLKKGDKVVLCADNCQDWFMAYYGIVYNGVWAVPVDAKLSDREIKNLVVDCGAKVCVLSDDVYETIAGEPEIMDRISEFVVIKPGEQALKNRKVKPFAQALEEGSKKKLRVRSLEPDDVASLIYTSGTTGNPKGVLLSHGNLTAQVEKMMTVVPYDHTDTEIAVLPLNHTFEFSIEDTLMYMGASICYAESLKSNRLFANIADCHVTLLLAVPMFFEKIFEGIMRTIRSMGFPVKQIIMGLFRWAKFLNKVRGSNVAGRRLFGFLRKKARLDTLKFVISGGAPLNYHVSEGLEAIGINVLNGYGITEASPVISVNRLRKGYRVINESVGTPLDGMEIKILDPDRNGHGEILARGATVMQGYYKNKAATKDALDADGFLHTGDVGKLETHGGFDYLYITGRCKNIIVTPGGKNVYPEEIEELLNQSDLVLESLVLGVPVSERSKGESIYALVVPNYEYIDSLESIQGFKNTEEHIQNLISKHVKEVNNGLRPYQRIVGFRVRREELPKTSTKKIKRFLFNGRDFTNQ